MRNTGWLNFFLGGLTFLLGVGFPGNPPMKTIQAFLGLATVFVSIWSIVLPSPTGVAIWSVVLGIAGTWNIIVAIRDQSLIVGIFGALQLWWTYRLYRTFRKNTQSAKPDTEALRLYNDLQRAVQRLNIRDDEDPDFIRIKVNRRWWQGFLLQDRVALVSRQGIALLIAERSKTTFIFRDGKGILGKRIAGTFDLDGISSNKVTFPRATFEHYNRWKGVSDAESIEWLNELDLSNRKRLPIRIAVILLLAAPIVFWLFWAVFALILVATYGK
jgi:hypothetical protein